MKKKYTKLVIFWLVCSVREVVCGIFWKFVFTENKKIVFARFFEEKTTQKYYVCILDIFLAKKEVPCNQ